jgi:hypothetical protein
VIEPESSRVTVPAILVCLFLFRDRVWRLRAQDLSVCRDPNKPQEPWAGGVRYNVMPNMKQFRDMDQLSGACDIPLLPCSLAAPYPLLPRRRCWVRVLSRYSRLFFMA